jgi:putative membrane protein
MNISRSILLLALAGVHSLAQAADAESAVPEPAIFVEQAAQTGLAEIEAAKAALAKSEDPGIRSFAQRMVKDHGQSNVELASLAMNKGITAPDKLDAEHQAMLDEITSKNGKEFDRTYSEHMNMGHSKALALFEAATKSPDPQLAAFAKKTLPTLQEHKQLAEKLPGKSSTRTSAGG